MASARKRILIVGKNDSFSRIDPLLDRPWFEVHRVSSGEMAVDLVRRLRFDLLAVREPLPDVGFGVFLARVREVIAKTPVLLLADEERLEQLAQYVGEKLVRVVAADESPHELQKTASELLGVAPRLSTRHMVALEVELEGETVRRMCQSANISETGMLVLTSHLFPVGMKVSMEIMLSGEPRPLAGEAIIVRHAVSEVEGVRGLGIRFLEFSGNGSERLHAYLRRQLEEDT
jgi:DNA-binding NtrC family response regulator